MRMQRGSATLLAIITMLVLMTGAASFAYVTSRNITIAQGYGNGLDGQDTVQAAINVLYVAGKESIDPANGWSTGRISNLQEWNGKTLNIVLPWGDTSQVKVTYDAAGDSYSMQATAISAGISRFAAVSAVSLTNNLDSSSTIAELINSGNKWYSASGYSWQLPANLDDPTTPTLSPGSGMSGSPWSSLASQVLFNDGLGYYFRASSNLQLVFRINDYIKLTGVAGSGSGTGYGVYYLAQKVYNSNLKAWTPGNAGDPTSYIVQFDPGLNPNFDTGNQPSGGAWGAAFTNTVNSSWPYGAFLVKKAWSDGSTGWQNEVWDNSGTYHAHFAFQNNNELVQRYYKSPSYTLAQDSDLPALLQNSTSPALQPPSVTRVPTTFGYNASGVFSPAMTGSYNSRPPDLRIAYSLGQIAEGNPWQASTYYPAGAKVAVGVWVDQPLTNRMVWVVSTAGISAVNKPSALGVQPSAGNTVRDGTVVWTAQAAPTDEQIANFILSNGISLAKVSMADVKFRLDCVNGTTAGPDQSLTDSYSVPFSMLLGNKNKITVQFWADNNNHRVHLIKLNDVLVLAFNDSYDTSNANKHNIVPQGWELNPSLVQMGTGIRIWDGAAEFYTADNYGDTLMATTNIGNWGR